jgi:hypothetical protein
VWEQTPGVLHGIFLSNLKRFAILIPRNVDPDQTSASFVRNDRYTIALTGKTLYLSVPNTGRVWTTPVPKPSRRLCLYRRGRALSPTHC